MKKLLGIIILSLLLSGCYATTHQISYWQHYNTCSNSFSDIRQIAECGKQNRTNYLAQTGMTNASSSSDGNMYVHFMDSLAGQVNDGKLTNNEAKMVWVQRTQELINGSIDCFILGADHQTQANLGWRPSNSSDFGLQTVKLKRLQRNAVKPC